MRLLNLSFTILLGSQLRSYESFRCFSHFSRMSRGAITGSFATDFEKLSQLCKVVAVPTNTTATLINLIQYGDTWAADAKRKSRGEFDRFKKGDKVPGCMADVRITTKFNYLAVEKENLGNSQDNLPRLSIEGSADSRVAQGILALLCEVSNRKSSHTS